MYFTYSGTKIEAESTIAPLDGASFQLHVLFFHEVEE